MKRFYETVSVVEADGGFAIALDGRPVRTPAQSPLSVPTASLAEAIAAEWSAQEAEVKPLAMLLTRLASTAIDKVPAERERFVEELVGYSESDLLCYRAEHPPELVARQVASWQPLLEWVAERHAAPLKVIQGVMPQPQPSETIASLREAVEAHDDWRFTALYSATTAAGSLVIALALLDGRLGADEAFDFSQLDESFQIEQWGLDAEAERRREAIRAELRAVAEFLDLYRNAG
ncbi:MAG: ATP12 family protein [Alphaproteobacteria bacterium]